VDVLLLHTRKLSVELIGFVSLPNIELGLPVRQSRATTMVLRTVALARVAVKVLEKTEERSEGDLGGVEVALEESHVA